MGSTTDIDKDNIIAASMEDLSEEEQWNIIALQEYVKNYCLLGVKKDRKGKTTRMQYFEMPAIKMKDHMIEEVCDRSEEWLRERREQLKGEVCQKFEAGKAMSVADTVEEALDRVHDEELDFGSSNDLDVVALRFRLLRQHGFFWVSADVFDKFRDDETGSFNINLSNDPRGLLSLYNAAHMAVPGETILDDAIAFTRRHLEAAKGKLTSPIKEQVSRALEIPLPRFMRQLEAMHYITEYEKEEPHDIMMLELAKINLNLLRSVHLKELKDLSLCHPYGEESSAARIILTKVFGLLVLIDDTFDVRATFEESQMLDDALQRWDESMVSLIPEYLRMFYIKTLSNFNEIEDTLEPYEKYRMAYVKKEQGKCDKDVASTVECYMREHGTTREEVVAAIAGMVEHAWRRINKACIEVKPAVEPVVRCLLNTTRVLEAYYLHGRDGLTYGRDLKELITFLFLKDVHV
ncbi:(-)-germacrene D synthase-like [Setaria italica]|uniref:(-)-germacrene D synthase-like n=1 Tax=Setaria italica TaxID=4555 RepID=UPI000BE4DEED|nr:(-)-germacrene D synthase-like [Setaria italica]